MAHIVNTYRKGAKQFKDTVISKNSTVSSPKYKVVKEVTLDTSGSQPGLSSQSVKKSVFMRAPAVQYIADGEFMASKKNVSTNFRKIRAPASQSVSVVKTTRPRFASLPSGGVLISHSEMISPVVSVGSNTYGVTSYRCNPGLANIFPWLSTIALNYEKYRFRRLVFHTASLAPTSTGGRIGLGFDYDSTDAVPQSRQEFYSLTTNSEGPVWDSLAMNVAVDQQFRFTGTHAVADSKLIDFGQFLVYTDAVAVASSVLADLFVDYEVELILPQQAQFYTQSMYLLSSPTVGNTLGVGTDATVIVGPNVVTSVTVPSTTTMVLNLPYGAYFVSYVIYNTGTMTSLTQTPGTGVTVNGTIANAATAGWAVMGVNVTGSTGTVTLTIAGITWTNVGNYRILVSRIAQGQVTKFA